MKLTQEQNNIIKSTGDIKINAVAGSGKTTTIIEYAKARPRNTKILYIAFNKSVKLEAIKKFTNSGLDNVKVETAHSLAYKHIVYKNHYQLKPNGYNTYEIAELLRLRGTGEKHAKYIVANHINKYLSYFCNSAVQKVRDLNYLDAVFDGEAKAFVSKYYDYIERQARLLLGKMDTGDIEITHDFYLKKFQLSNPLLHYDYILFDEGQDASAAMLDVFVKQKTTKVIVGDTHQQIYGWRFAVNSLEKTRFKTYSLTKSFRFNQDIANLAMEVLKWKNQLNPHKTIPIYGAGTDKGFKVKAVLARTNLGLLLKAIEYITEKKGINHIYFEGNINSYTYADEGASLYDILNLYNGNPGLIRNKLISEMKGIFELENYVEKTEDIQLGLMIDIVKEYGNEIPQILNEIKNKHVADDQKEKAEMIFSTVHRCKGMEYDSVHIVNDFINEQKLEKLKTQDEMNISKLIEEINLLYVAITRTKNTIYIPETLVPKGIPLSSQIHILKVETEKEKREKEISKFHKRPIDNYTKKVYLKDQISEKHKAAYLPWAADDDEELAAMQSVGSSISKMAKHFGRTKGAIISRLRKLELEGMF